MPTLASTGIFFFRCLPVKQGSLLSKFLIFFSVSGVILRASPVPDFLVMTGESGWLFAWLRMRQRVRCDICSCFLIHFCGTFALKTPLPLSSALGRSVWIFLFCIHGECENLPNVTECDCFLWLWRAETSALESESTLRTPVLSLLAGKYSYRGGKYSYRGVSQLGYHQQRFL
jgi:hypothetical protein